MSRSTTYIVLIPLLVMGLSYQAFAQDQKSYVGGALGYSDIEVNVDSPQKSSVSDSPLAYKLYGGVYFLPFLAGEITLASFDETQKSIDSDTDLSVRDDTIMLQGVASIPVGKRIGVFGKLGPVFVRRDVEVTDSDPADSDVSVDTDDVGTAIGAGARYSVTDRISLRAELEALFYDADIDTDSDLGEIESTSERIIGTVGVQFNF